MKLNIGVVGATGMVGEVFLSLMERREFPVNNLKLFASERSEGQQYQFQDRVFEVETLKEGCFDGLDLVFFSSGDDISREWAPRAVESGAFAVDNSAAFRMSPDHSLIVPEINGHLLPNKSKPAVIANPNCSTIQLVMALAPLAKDFKINSVRVATYQAVSGAGKVGWDELLGQLKDYFDDTSKVSPTAFAHPIAFNALPHIGSFNDEGFCSEEMKIMKETKKILGRDDLKVSAFTVRVPCLNGHSEVAWVSFDKAPDKSQILACLEKMDGVRVVPHNENDQYPTVRDVSGEYDVYVGRIHQDMDDPNTWMMWIVADNLLKGAALNGLQIAERIFDIR